MITWYVVHDSASINLCLKHDVAPAANERDLDEEERMIAEALALSVEEATRNNNRPTTPTPYTTPADVGVEPRAGGLSDSQLAVQMNDEELARSLQEQEEVSDMSTEEPQYTYSSGLTPDPLRNLSAEAALLRQQQQQQQREAEAERERLRLEAQEREQLRQEQNAAYENALREDARKAEEEQQAVRAQQQREREELAAAVHAEQEAAARKEEEEAKAFSLRLTIENELEHKQRLVAQRPTPTDAAPTKDLCLLSIRQSGGSPLQLRLFATDTLESVYDFVDIQLLSNALSILKQEQETTATTDTTNTQPNDTITTTQPQSCVRYPLRYHLVTSYPTARLARDSSTSLQVAGLCPRTVLNIEWEVSPAPSPSPSPASAHQL
eukprot:TRINITY_DN2172_c0_g1_i1.p1 TRINITY_DN2172_c0_g1~~TRINITY_DN2172_c0_g1_i1.p1  ORF type:complete len:381 (-),score=101.89 TRINITY_DN2172_c0_g1_i1:66-1208(-)